MGVFKNGGQPCTGTEWPALGCFAQSFGADHAPGPGRDPASARGDADAHPGKLRVLVVDDNPVNLMIASEMLSAWGITPQLAADGAEAVAVATELQFDLILMDLQMPVLDGLSAARQIRNLRCEPAGTRVTIVAYTSTSPSQSQLRASGIDGVLAKPCDMNALHDCLTQWCPSAAAAVASCARTGSSNAARTNEFRSHAQAHP